MTKTSSLVLAATMAILGSSPSSASTLVKAWVSGHGTDAAGCGSATAPCRNFQYAHDNIVSPGGSIYVLDSAGYGQLVITHAISIINDGVGTAAIFAASGDAINIQAGATDAVVIKGLTLDGVGTGGNGINLISGGNLTVANCLIKGFKLNGYAGNGIILYPTAGNITFNISDTVVTGNGYAGINIFPNFQSPNNNSVTGTLTRLEVTNNNFGVNVNGLAVAGGNGKVETYANQVNASDNLNSGFGVINGSLYLTKSTATGNKYGVDNSFPSGGVGAFTFGDNVINGNATADVNGYAMSTARSFK